MAVLNDVHRTLSTRSSAEVGGLSLLLVAVIGFGDLMTSYELSFSIFYTLPIAVAAWYSERRLALGIAILAAATWFATDWLSGQRYSHPALQVWNIAVRLGFFLIIAMLLVRLRESLALQTRLARHDGLTGLLVARAFRQACDDRFRLAQRHGRPLALGYLDLDGFKGVNDSCGHAVGDRVLQAVAETLQERLRRHDLCARLGGDEFAVLLSETDMGGARSVFAALCSSLDERVAREGWPVGFSVGVAVFDPPTVGVEEAMRCADALMYTVKRAGRSGLRVEAVTPAAAPSS